MRRVAGVFPQSLRLRKAHRPRKAQPSVHPTTTFAALTLAAVLAAAALYIGAKAPRYLPDHIAINSWQPPRPARDDAAPEPTQSSNRARKAAREPVHMEARLAPPLVDPSRQGALRAASRIGSGTGSQDEAETGAGDPSRLGAEPRAPQGEDATEPETGRASWYDLSTKTASGEDMDGDALTAAHRTLPLGTRVRVANLDNGRAVVVRINDRGPFAKDRIIDLSKAAAARLGMIADGVANVAVTPVAGDVASN